MARLNVDTFRRGEHTIVAVYHGDDLVRADLYCGAEHLETATEKQTVMRWLD